ncbi:polysaccharide deacetylase family protein [Echinicola marina]|uniref:polysaccharide deacetylase family protein n=1 Tax=Echinicola marina TaxID=2859768 RepID=UPI001CF677F2|nr:polysaccharide deacetylase family protein [Echinicola marina]UCS95340.1 polysaccharide deacetylase family protein [Echinicola marina]
MEVAKSLYGNGLWRRNLVFLLPCLLFANLILAQSENNFIYSHGAIIRGDQSQKQIALVFTGHEYAEGGTEILNTLAEYHVKASFFFTGDFYRNPDFQHLIKKINHQKHYLGAHSDQHLLYCDWIDRDSLLIDEAVFIKDIKDNYHEMSKKGIALQESPYYLPPYEWYNDTISKWTKELNLQLINFSPGTRSNADYTHPGMSNYLSSKEIFKSIISYEEEEGLNGFILLMHVGVGPKRKDKFYDLLPVLLEQLQSKGYQFVKIDQLLRSPKIYK